MKLELKHLAPYLPYGLKIYNKGEYSDNENKILKQFEMIGLGDFVEYYETGRTVTDENYYKNVLPILRPLSDLTKEHLSVLFGYETEDDIVDFEIITTPNNEFAYIEYELFGIGHISKSIAGYNELQKLFSEHWDIFNLISKGLAIDIKSINQ